MPVKNKKTAKKTAAKKIAKKKVSTKKTDLKPTSLPEVTDEEIAMTTPKKRRISEKVQEKLNERIRILIRLSKEQGYLTYKDINQALPEGINNPEEIENVIIWSQSHHFWKNHVGH